MVERQFEVFAATVDGQVCRVGQVNNAIGFNSGHASGIVHALVLPGAKRHQSLDHDRLNFGPFQASSEEQGLVDHVGRSGRLDSRRVAEQSVRAVKVRVHHDWRPATQVNVLLPPIGYVVSRPPENPSLLGFSIGF